MVVMLKRVFSAVVLIIEVSLIVRFILKCLGVQEAAFVGRLYDLTEPLIWPFIPMLPAPAVRDRMVIEFTTLFALFVYAIVGYIVQEFLRILNQRLQVTH